MAKDPSEVSNALPLLVMANIASPKQIHNIVRLEDGVSPKDPLPETSTGTSPAGYGSAIDNMNLDNDSLTIDFLLSNWIEFFHSKAYIVLYHLPVQVEDSSVGVGWGVDEMMKTVKKLLAVVLATVIAGGLLADVPQVSAEEWFLVPL